jgi:hypothetical protein
MVTKIEPFESADITLLDFCLWGLMKSEVYKGRRMDKANFLLEVECHCPHKQMWRSPQMNNM